MITLEQIAPYLPYGLKYDFNVHDLHPKAPKETRVKTLYGDNIDFCLKHYRKLHLHSLDKLTEPIRVEGYNDGKEFVPIIEIEENHYQHFEEMQYILEDERWLNQCSHLFVKLLYQWHFAIGIDKEDYIEIEQ